MLKTTNPFSVLDDIHDTPTINQKTTPKIKKQKKTPLVLIKKGRKTLLQMNKSTTNQDQPIPFPIPISHLQTRTSVHKHPDDDLDDLDDTWVFAHNDWDINCSTPWNSYDYLPYVSSEPDDDDQHYTSDLPQNNKSLYVY